MSEPQGVDVPMIVHVAKQENASVMADGNEYRQMSITFTFNPDVVEAVRTKDKSWLIRLKR